MATYIEKGKENWAVRLRKRGYPEVYRAGFRTKTEAKDWVKEVGASAFPSKNVKGDGPRHTTLAEGLNDYVKVVTRKQAGCKQALCKINKYLEGGGLPRLKAIQVKGGRVFNKDADGNPNAAQQEVQKPEFQLVEEPAQAVHQGAQQAGFARRGKEVRAKGERAQALRAQLANTNVADVQSFHFEELVQLMEEAGYKANTIRQELAILSGFFTHAMRTWKWRLDENPLLTFDWPEATNRERVLSDDEAMRLSAALSHCRNQKFRYFVLFAVESAMRKGEAISTACWCDVDWERSVLSLPHAKAGRREVPLTAAAVEMLKELGPGDPTEQIFGLTDSQVQSAWKRVCKAAKLVDLNIHDLRHTAATFYAKALNGNKFVLKLVTGHRSDTMLGRYVNLRADDAVQALSALSMPTLGQRMFKASDVNLPLQAGASDDAGTGSGSGNVVNFSARRAHLALVGSKTPAQQEASVASGLMGCWRRPNFDHPRRLNFDQGRRLSR